MSSPKKPASKAKTITHGEKRIEYSRAVPRKVRTKLHMVGFGTFTGSRKAKSAEGYKLKNGILVKNDYQQTVPPSALKKGFEKAKSEIEEMLNEVMSMVTDNSRVSELELSISFSADGKFMGFGVGGAATIKIKMIPTRTKE